MSITDDPSIFNPTPETHLANLCGLLLTLDEGHSTIETVDRPEHPFFIVSMEITPTGHRLILNRSLLTKYATK